MNDNIKHLRNIIKDELFSDEACEFLDELQEQLADKDDKIDELKKNVYELEDQISDTRDTKGCSHTIGGLDVITIHLQEENIEVRRHVDTFLDRLKSHYNSTQA